MESDLRHMIRLEIFRLKAMWNIVFISLNLFMAEPTIDRLSSMYFYAWEKGLKTTYYLRSKSKTQIKKIESEKNTKQYSEEEKILCSIENPESCEACQ